MSGDQGAEDQTSSGAGPFRAADLALPSAQPEDIDALIKAASLRILASLHAIEAPATGEETVQPQAAEPIDQGNRAEANGEPADTASLPAADFAREPRAEVEADPQSLPSSETIAERDEPTVQVAPVIADVPLTALADEDRRIPLVEPKPHTPVPSPVASSEADSLERTVPLHSVDVGAVTATGRGAGIRGWLSGPWTIGRVARYAGLAIGAYFGVVLFLILIYRFINPPTTTLIAYQWLTGTQIEQDWVAIEDISPNLLRAVVVSEDWGFCHHYGVDLDAIEKALEQAGEGKIARGASTISMQVIKNLFLSQSKSYLRKAIEIPLTFVAEVIWPKSRMLEIYLNIAEWGPGVFGAEAAARHHFNKPASRLTEREAALLAAALPNPILRDAGDPGTRTARKASVIQSRMRAAGPVANCAMPAKPRPAAETPSEGWQTTVKKRAGAP